MAKSSSRKRPAGRGRSSGNINVELAIEVRGKLANSQRLRIGVLQVLAGEGIREADISLAIVDDKTIHQLNNRYLGHDEPTDVISFALEERKAAVHGQIVISVDTAARAAKEFGWSMEDELLLYAIHGALHLAGYEDSTAASRGEMRRREQHYLAHFDLKPRYQSAGGRRS